MDLFPDPFPRRKAANLLRWPRDAAIIAAMAKNQGHIIIQSGVNVWPHELKTAQAFTLIGKDVGHGR